MQSPELLLKDLNRALLELNAATVFLNDKELASALKDVTRRLVLAEVLVGKSIIAVGGSQGAGKTTLMLSMYGLEGGGVDWLNPNEGRGERLPVLILEDQSCVAPRGALRELGPLDKTNQRFGVTERSVEVEEFQSAICNADTSVVLPVLYVPQTYFKHPGQAFLLLPGYEREDSNNAPWQQLMRQALVGAAGCLIVTDETRLAGQRETEIVRDMLSKDLPGTHPLIVISKTEGLTANSDRMNELRSRAAEVFNVPADEVSRRVHCVGATDQAYKTQWIPRLGAALADMAIGGVSARQTQLSRLHDVLEQQLGGVLKLADNLARVRFRSGAAEDGGASQVVTRVLEAFDEAESDLREKFKVAVKDLVASHSNGAWEDLQSKLITDYEGVMPKLKGLLDTVSEKHQRLVRDTQLAWQNNGNVLEAFAAQTGALTHKKLGAPPVLAAPNDSGVFKRLAYVDGDGAVTTWGRPTADDLRNMQVMLGSASADASLPVTATKELESTVRLLPALALEYARLASLMPALVGVDPKTLASLPVGDVNAAMQSVKQQFEQATDISKSILRGIAMLTAVDVGLDGHLDGVSALISALTGSANATAGTVATAAGEATATTATTATVGGVSVAGAVVGVVAVGYLAHSALQEVRRHDGLVRSVAQQMLASISDHHQAHFLSHFNQLMSELRQHLQQRLRSRYKLDEQLMTHDRLAKALADVSGGRLDLLEQLALSGRSLAVMSSNSH